MNKTEIKAGQRWLNRCTSNIYVNVIFCDEECVLYKYMGHDKCFLVSVRSFREGFSFAHEPKTRPITKEDILKMLALNPVIFSRLDSDGQWCILGNPEGRNFFNGYQYSHNPFSPDPVIVGPEIEVVE